VKIAILPGDGIGTEIVVQAERVLAALDLRIESERALVGGRMGRAQPLGIALDHLVVACRTLAAGRASPDSAR